MPTKLNVVTPLGTFTRSTVRTYTHLVVVKGFRAERREASRVTEIANLRKEVAKYRRTVETGVDPTDDRVQSRDFTARSLANGSYAKWILDTDASIAKLEAQGPITEDGDTFCGGTPSWNVLGWCGRLDLAGKLAASKEADRYRHVAVVEVATGAVVTVR